MKLDRGSEFHLCGPSPVRLKILDVTCAVVWIPLRRINYVSKLFSSSDGKQRNVHNVAVDNLYHHERAIVGHDIECLGFDIGILVGAPPQVVFGQDSVGRLLCLLCNGPDGFGAIDGFLRSSNACETTCG